MTTWLCILNESNWRIVKNKNIWGVSNRHAQLIRHVKEGDSLVFYIKGLYEVAGIFEVVSSPFQDSKRIFNANGFDQKERFKDRVRIQEKIVPSEPFDFRALIPDLELFKRKDRWGPRLQGRAMIKLSDQDFHLIRKALLK